MIRIPHFLMILIKLVVRLLNNLGILGWPLIRTFSPQIHEILFNIGSKDCISKFDFGVKVANKFNLNKKNIIKYKSQFKKDNRPLNTFMHTNKLKKIIKIKIKLIKNGLELL